jgi:4-amino-4-deoxy-L-arabinose transferase-like glycosyltransferase
VSEGGGRPVPDPPIQPGNVRLRRVVNVVLGAALVAAPLLGLLNPPVLAWIVGSLGVSSLLNGAATGTRWAACARLGTMLLLGIVGQLGLTEPLWLQRLRIAPSEFRGLTSLDGLFVALIFVQCVMVVGFTFGMWRSHIRDLLPWRRRAIGWTRVIAGALLFVACAAHLTRYVDKPQFSVLSYGAQIVATALLWLLNLVNVLLVFAAVPVDAARRVRDWFAALRWDRAIPWALAAFAFAASLLLGWVALDQVPHIPDELSYLFQAECFARGLYWGDAPPNPAAFKVYLITAENGRWFAVTPPGWPAVLALGSAIGAPWLVNPILGGLAVLLAHALTKRLLGVKAAHLVALLMAVSPWLLYLSASYMTHPVSLVLMLAAWWCLARAREPDARPVPLSLLGGACLGWLALVRQLDAVLVAGVFGLWMLGLFGERRAWREIAAFAAGCVAVAALIFPYNAAMTGDPFSFPINAYLDKLWYPGANRLGFGADVGNPTGSWGDLDPFPGHGLRDVLINTNQNLYATNWELFGWGIGSLFFAAIHLFFGKKTRLDKLMIFAIVVLLLGYHLYWFSGGPDFGARYWYLMIFPLVVLTVRGIHTAVEGLRRGSAGDSAPERMGGVIGVLVLITLLVFIPWRAVARYQDYRGFHADYAELEKTIDPNALVFVKTAAIADFSSALIRNSPRQTDRQPIFAADLGEAENQKLIKAFPDRPVYYVTGRSVGDGPTRVASGPPSPPR